MGRRAQRAVGIGLLVVGLALIGVLWVGLAQARQASTRGAAPDRRLRVLECLMQLAQAIPQRGDAPVDLGRRVLLIIRAGMAVGVVAAAAGVRVTARSFGAATPQLPT